MDIVLNHLVNKLVDTSIDLLKQGLKSVLGVSQEIEKLSYTLRSIQAALNDAQQQQITEHSVKLWLSRLTDVMYDADDILDEYRIKAEEWASQGSQTQPFYTRFLHGKFNFLHGKFNLNIRKKIKDLNKRVEKIWADKSNFDFRMSDGQREVVARVGRHVVSRVRRETSSGVEPDLAGEAIKKATSDLIRLLLRKDKDANANVIVLAIVGIGGIGKTTLAQNIFHKCKAAFKKSMWVCVSQESEETHLLREIVANAGESPGEARSKEQLETKVKDVLMDRKFLLVLDDVWDAQIWEDWLRKPLQVGAVGSRVLVTTRNKGVAERMKAKEIHEVDALSLDDSWLLLCKKVTKDADEERHVESLKDIGMEIVKKCQGLPLAIIAIGGVLCGKLRRCEWERIERSLAWSRTGLPDGVHQALYLSYEELPSHLRQCYLHCSLFREDSKLKCANLIEIWVAEGFVVKVEGEELEEIAEGYYNELVQRSLLEDFGTYSMMHDLMRSLCHFLARGESSVITDIYKHTADEEDTIKLRRLSIVALESQDIKYVLSSIHYHKSVRTLLLERVQVLDDKDVDHCFNNFQRIRVVHLGKTWIQSLPQSVKKLLHLRYLNLFGCLKLEALPESIAELKCLQFLILEKCINLETLPKGVVKLHNLRTLNLSDVPLKELPSGIDGLENLNVLKGAVVSSISSSSSSSSCSLEEIGHLGKLRELSIYNLEKTSAESDPNVNGLNSSLMAFNNLVDLTLNCGPYSLKVEQRMAAMEEETSYTEEETDSPHIVESGQHEQEGTSYMEEETDSSHILESGQDEEEGTSYMEEETDSPHILESGQHVASYTEETDRIQKIFDMALHPPSCVRKINIYRFFGHQFPQWLMSNDISSLLPKLTKLELNSCGSCWQLPPLGKLPNLEWLILEDLFALRRICANFFGCEEASTSVGHESGGSKSASSSPPPFPSLKTLYLAYMHNLEAWDWVPEDGRIVAMPRLNVLIVFCCPKLLSLPKGLKHQDIHLTEINIGERTNLNSISGFSSVKSLEVFCTKGLKHVSHLPALEQLHVELVEEQNLFLPDWLVHSLPYLASLQKLKLVYRGQQLDFNYVQDDSYWFKIKHIPVVEISDLDGNYISYIKSPPSFHTNII